MYASKFPFSLIDGVTSLYFRRKKGPWFYARSAGPTTKNYTFLVQVMRTPLGSSRTRCMRVNSCRSLEQDPRREGWGRARHGPWDMCMQGNHDSLIISS